MKEYFDDHLNFRDDDRGEWVAKGRDKDDIGEENIHTAIKKIGKRVKSAVLDGTAATFFKIKEASGPSGLR